MKKRNQPARLPCLRDVELAIKNLAPTWAGRCFEVASLAVQAPGLLPPSAVAVYGHFLGKVHPESYFGKLRHGAPFIQHGWVLLPDNRIFDLTRWSFEKRRPYLFVGENDGDYDEGGNQWRQTMRGPPPPWNPGEKRYSFTSRMLSTDAWGHVERLFRLEYGTSGINDDEDQSPGTLCQSQLFWLANAPYDSLAPHTPQIYGALEEMGEAEWIPWDNRERARRENSRASQKEHSDEE